MQSGRRLNLWKRQLDFLLEHSYDAIIVQDDQKKIIFTSPSTERLIGRKSGEMIGKDTLTFIHSDDRNELRTILIKLDSAKKKSLKCKCRIITNSGELNWV
jgi:PAS domain S-box-containing protein